MPRPTSNIADVEPPVSTAASRPPPTPASVTPSTLKWIGRRVCPNASKQRYPPIAMKVMISRSPVLSGRDDQNPTGDCTSWVGYGRS